MPSNTVRAFGFSVTEGEDRFTYDVTTWYRVGSELGSVRETYLGLSWTEVIDVALADMDASRPGWEFTPYGHQPPLWIVED